MEYTYLFILASHLIVSPFSDSDHFVLPACQTFNYWLRKKIYTHNDNTHFYQHLYLTYNNKIIHLKL